MHFVQMNAKIIPQAMLQNNETKIDINNYVPGENEYEGSPVVLKNTN